MASNQGFIDRQKIEQFVTVCRDFSSEKEHATTFLNRLFQACGYLDAIAAGAEFEAPIPNASPNGKTGYADLLWRQVDETPAGQWSRLGVLFEMKSRGEDLHKHLPQAKRYWSNITPGRPRFIVLCNFAELHIYDFDRQVQDPIDIIPFEELPDRYGSLRFMVGDENPPFQNNQAEITEQVARRMGELYGSIYKRLSKKSNFQENTLQRFILQCVLCMFAEDRALLPDTLFQRQVQRCLKKEETCYDVLGTLFRLMNEPGVVPVGRFKGVEYFNGGLFSQVETIELEEPEWDLLLLAAQSKWDKVRPSIFGNIFESVIEHSKTVNGNGSNGSRKLESERRKHGIHFTAEVDILKIVYPTITVYWEEKIAAATTLTEAIALQSELSNYKVFDPACGSGNFLYVAYIELKGIEVQLREAIATLGGTAQLEPLVSPMQFFGIDQSQFAVELARVTLSIARRIAIDKYGLVSEPSLPLDQLDQNIVCGDALFYPWPEVDAIIGNPPFLGGKHARLALGDAYMERVFKRFEDVKDSVDFCSYWFRLAHDRLKEDGRAGLVATNSIAQGKSRAAALDYIVANGGFIHTAVSSQPWYVKTDEEKRTDKAQRAGSKANVHVSLVNWCKRQPSRLVLDEREVLRISPSLSDKVDVSGAVRLRANLNWCFQGVIPIGKGFIVTEDLVNEWIKADPKNAEVLKLFSMGANLAKNVDGKPDRWIIDFNNQSLEEAEEYHLPFQYLQENVKLERSKNRRKVTKENWWKYGEKRPKMRHEIESLSSYLTVPRVSKWAVFLPVPKEWLPGDKSIVIGTQDFYVLGVLLSSTHRSWIQAQKSTLKSDIAYTHKTCFETFPFPQKPTIKQSEKIREKALELYEYRSQVMDQKGYGITALYNQYFNEPSSQLAKLHQQLDKLVLAAYRFSPNDDPLEKLLELNQHLAHQEQQNQPIIGPWDPHNPPDRVTSANI
ncbi:MAG: class I SAM-dependent DNA methyltransferase [Coleofasciculaceae cyanobacterium RL_1_1]|nr:class I SAM-dependent DNA methyltransferase [Coleofasciculaceae cyanobacterium RL_1_1]